MIGQRIVIGFVLLSSFVLASVAKESNDVVVLTSDNFDQLTSKGDWLLKFHAPWCGHCKRLAPKYASVATKLKGSVNLGSIDATTEPALAARFVVLGYPTIFFMRGTDVRQFNGNRNEDGMTYFATEGWKKAESIGFLQSPFGFMFKGGVAKLGMSIWKLYKLMVDTYSVHWIAATGVLVLCGMLIMILVMIFSVWLLAPKEKQD